MWQNLRISLVVAAAVTLPLCKTSAQLAPSSNNVLFAAYCLGVINAERDLVERFQAKLGPIPGEQQPWRRSLERDRQRFLSYLLFNGDLTSLSVMAGIQNGGADVRDIEANMNEALRRCELPNPTMDDLKTHGKEWFNAEWLRRKAATTACLEKTPHPASEERTARCHDPSAFPW